MNQVLAHNKVDSIESIYRLLSDENDNKRDFAQLLLYIRHWLSVSIEFDTSSNTVINKGVLEFLGNITDTINQECNNTAMQDRLYRIIEHTTEAIINIGHQPKNKILQGHAMLPIYAAKELDSKSVQWLSKQPGRTVREKLAGKPYIKAVHRRFSLDTAENRLFKAYACKLEKILSHRQELFPIDENESYTELLMTVLRWLRSEENSEIGLWQNLPPNNTLLEDRSYKKIWHGWTKLKNIDFNIKKDARRLNQDVLHVIYWSTLATLNNTSRFRVVQQPLDVDYDNFDIATQSDVLTCYLFEETQNDLFIGVVKSVVKDKNFGFIAKSNSKRHKSKDVFFHESHLSAKKKIIDINVGDAVSFSIGSNDKGEHAKNITLISAKQSAKKMQFHIRDNTHLCITLDNQKYVVTVTENGLTVTDTHNKKYLHPIHAADIHKLVSWLLTTVLQDGANYKSIPIKNIHNRRIYDNPVIDLYSIRPLFYAGEKNKVLPFRLLLQYWSKNIDKNITTMRMVDCADAKAIKIDSTIYSISMKTLFDNKKIDDNKVKNDELKNSAVNHFVRQLKDFYHSDDITYLVPDWRNDFELKFIRQSMNFHFRTAKSLPTSIATLLSWHTSDEFIKSDIKNNDVVIILSRCNEGIAITPIQASYNKGLHKIIPESHGIMWNRHPTVIDKNNNQKVKTVELLNKKYIKNTKEITQLFSVDGLLAEIDKLSFVEKETWHHLESEIKQGLNNITTEFYIKDLQPALANIKNYKKVFVLTTDKNVSKPKNLQKNYEWHNIDNALKGVNKLQEWEDELSSQNIYIWKDYLPPLSIDIKQEDGHYGRFYLVDKNTSIEPTFGIPVNIPINEIFTLPANKLHYEFPLIQGNSSSESTRFVACIKSSHFPLKKDTVCRLIMTYTYGADDPYTLTLIPIDKEHAPFDKLNVEWKQLDDEDIDYDKLSIPDFPKPHTWEDLTKTPSKKANKKPIDINDWIKREFQNISDVAEYGYHTEIIDSDWKTDRNNKKYCFINDIYFNDKSLLGQNNEILQKGSAVSFYKVTGRKNELQIRDMTPSHIKANSCFLKSIRFPALTIWKYGYCLDSEDYMSSEFKNDVKKCIDDALVIMNNPDMPESSQKEMFNFLCYLHQDTPEQISNYLLRMARNQKVVSFDYKRQIAFAIGDAKLDWQKELFEGAVETCDIEILSVALWRTKDLVYTLSGQSDVVKKLLNRIFQSLKSDFESSNKNNRKNKLGKCFELLLALVRLRSLDSPEEVRKLFYPNNSLVMKYVELIDEISKNKNIVRKIDSKITFSSVKQDDELNIVSTLRMYLTNDDGSNAIAIVINDDE